jgi:hypothetical protein
MSTLAILAKLADIERRLDFIIQWQSLAGHWKNAEEARKLEEMEKPDGQG